MPLRLRGEFLFRSFRFKAIAIAAAWAAIAFASMKDPEIGQAAAATASRRAESMGPASPRQVYEANCAVCHGAQGDGNGPAAAMFITRPRDFRTGVFKFRSTPSGSLPTDDDLLWTITHGLRWTGMIAQPELSDAERRAVVQYIKTFSPRFADEKPALPIHVPRRPERNSKLIVEGERLFRDTDCATCHGERGRGDGPSAADMKDDWGWSIKPGDLSWRPLKRGSALEQIYLTIATGMSGTPMPAFAESLQSQQIWALVYYLESLVPGDRRLPPGRLLGEEQQGRRALHMGGMMGRQGFR